MNSSNPTKMPLLILLRWTARLSSLFFTGIFLLMLLGEGFDPVKITHREWVSLFFFPLGLILGLTLAWWKEGLGGVLALGATFAGIFISDANTSGGGYMLLCASPALLFILYWFLSQPAEVVPDEVRTVKHVKPVEMSSEVLKTRTDRIAANLCPKCGSAIKVFAKNCPNCMINLTFARAHLDAW